MKGTSPVTKLIATLSKTIIIFWGVTPCSVDNQTTRCHIQQEVIVTIAKTSDVTKSRLAVVVGMFMYVCTTYVCMYAISVGELKLGKLRIRKILGITGFLEFVHPPKF